MKSPPRWSPWINQGFWMYKIMHGVYRLWVLVLASVTGAIAGDGRQGYDRMDLALARAQVFESVDQAELAGGLSVRSQEIWERERAAFPDVDLTEVQAFYGMLSERRGQFGHEIAANKRPVLREWLAEVDELHREMVMLRAGQAGVPTSGTDEQGRGFALIGFDGGQPQYVFTSNVAAAISTGANLVRWNADFDPALGGTVDGSGLYVNVNDYEKIVEHTEFLLPSGGSRIMVAETPWYEANGDHMTHVAGTVGAWGYDSTLLGMAPRVWLRALIQQTETHVSTYAMSYPGELHNVTNPRTGEMQMKSVMGTTSLGSDEHNLRYTNVSSAFDARLRDHPYYIHFYAAGNNGSGFGTLSNDRQISKNTLTIGAVADVTRDAEGNYVSGGGIAGFSSRGPTYDGRIKPDFTANGVGLRSTSGATGSSNKSGTSMATPNASGSTVLLMD